MGDPMNPNSISLLPGCRFYPSEEQLVCYYLTHKNNDDRRFRFDVINEVDLYNYDPSDLPETARFRFGRGGRRTHWYCFAAARVLMEKGRKRRAGGGYWKRTARVRDVMGGAAGKVVVGTRKRLVFYLGDSPKNAVMTNWVMHEYALTDHQKASFVLCRVFDKSRSRNNVSDHVLSSCGEESVATVRHIGIQHDGTITSGIDEAIVHDDDSVDRKNEVLRFPMGLVSQVDDQIAAGAVALASVRLPSSRQPNELVTASGHTSGVSLFVDDLAANDLIAILEEDFIELDDIACPLAGIDLATEIPGCNSHPRLELQSNISDGVHRTPFRRG